MKSAGISEGTEDAVANPMVVATRRKIVVQADNGVNRDGADVTIEMTDGRIHHRRIEHGIGSLKQPMSIEALEKKFMDQAELVLPRNKAESVSSLSWKIAELDDVSEITDIAKP